jgi:hypothetical protein
MVLQQAVKVVHQAIQDHQRAIQVAQESPDVDQ